MRKDQVLSREACRLIRQGVVTGQAVTWPSTVIAAVPNGDGYAVRAEALRAGRRAGAKLDRAKTGLIFAHESEARAWVTGLHLPVTMPIRGDVSSFFPTPPAVADPLLDEITWADLPTGARVLEPSAGEGHLVGQILARLEQAGRRDVTIDCIEWQYDRQQFLRTIFAGHPQVHVLDWSDFLDYHPVIGYDVIVMNPPFNTPGLKNAYVAHVQHASTLLCAEGVVVAVVPPNWRFGADKKLSGFRAWVEEHASNLIDLPADGFESVGTSVATVGLLIVQPEPALPRPVAPNPYLDPDPPGVVVVDDGPGTYVPNLPATAPAPPAPTEAAARARLAAAIGWPDPPGDPMPPDRVWDLAQAAGVALQDHLDCAVARVALKRHGLQPESPAEPLGLAAPTPVEPGTYVPNPDPPPPAPARAQTYDLPTKLEDLQLAMEGSRLRWQQTPATDHVARARAHNLYAIDHYRLTYFKQHGRVPTTTKKGSRT